MKYLILNCDDFGQSPATNQAIMHLLEEKKVSSATIMVPAPAFDEAASWCRLHPEAPIGLHLTFTSEFTAMRWSSLTGHASLHDETRHMPMTVLQFEQQADSAAIVAEMEAQFERAKQSGLQITHADNHMGSLYGVETGRNFLPEVLQQCANRRIPFRFFRYVDPNDRFLFSIPNIEARMAPVIALADSLGVGIPDYLLSHPYPIEQGKTYESFKSMLINKLYHLPDGIVETYIHPGVEDEWMQQHIPNWEKRVWEYKLMLDEDWSYALRDADVKLIDYRYFH